MGKYYTIKGDFITSDELQDSFVYLTEDAIAADYLLKGDIERLREFSYQLDGAIILNRYHNDEKSTAGQFFALGESEFEGYTMERGGTPSTLANQSLPIPEGIYSTYPRAEGPFSNAFAFRIVNLAVPRSRGILGHVGNKPEDSVGCVLFGLSSVNNQKISRSRDAMKKFETFFKGKNKVMLIINKCY